MANAFALKWLRELISRAKTDKPPNHSSIVALAAVLVKHADPDGSHVFPSQETMAIETGVSRPTIRNALAYLAEAGLIRKVRNRSRGLHEYQLQMPNEFPTETSDGKSDGKSDGNSVSTTSVDLRGPPEAAADEQLGFDGFLKRKALDEAKRRKASDSSINNIRGIAGWIITKDPEFVEGARHEWDHRNCDECSAGYEETYAPGAGMVKVRCTAQVEANPHTAQIPVTA
jgi:DNA-binding transcriptional ArsR family regulator